MKLNLNLVCDRTPITFGPNDEVLVSPKKTGPTIWRVYERKKKRGEKDTVKGNA